MRWESSFSLVSCLCVPVKALGDFYNWLDMCRHTRLTINLFIDLLFLSTHPGVFFSRHRCASEKITVWKSHNPVFPFLLSYVGVWDFLVFSSSLSFVRVLGGRNGVWVDLRREGWV